MEARSRLSQAGTPSIVVFFDRSDLTNASGDVASIFLSALNSPDYILAMSVRTTHAATWLKDGTANEGIVSNEQLARMKQNSSITNIQILQDEGMYLTFFAADEETQRKIQEVQRKIQEQELQPQSGEQKESQVQDSFSVTSPPPQQTQKSNLEEFMRPTS
jgi:lipopolysaccharide export LptBFGC system permease protein LptF